MKQAARTKKRPPPVGGVVRERRRSASVPLVEEITCLTPVEAFERLAGLPHLLFLDSAVRHATLGRYSFLSADPFTWLWSRRGHVHLHGQSQSLTADPFAVLAERLARFRAESIAGLPPFQGGAAGLFGYDLCHHVEVLPRPRHDEFHVPDAALGLYDWVLAFDHRQERCWLISTGFPETEPERRRRHAEKRLAAVTRLLATSSTPSPRHPVTPSPRHPVTPSPSYPVTSHPNLPTNFTRDGYLQAVQRAIDYVHAGDCFQVNLAQRLLHPATMPARELYLRLRDCNPATFAGYFDLGDFVLASASPERFLQVTDGEVEARPIKGTRPRGANPAEDRAQARDLLHSAKDRAENVMIVDLIRNDLGRVCAYGSIRVPAVCRLETYEFVHHLVSEVRGRLRLEATPVDLLRAAFPGGSVTGAPKIRAMEVIAELEPTARGPYCGCLGYLGFDGAMDTNILIRTFTVGRGWVQFPVGGGVVADSVPAQEYEETWNKARGLLTALQTR